MQSDTTERKQRATTALASVARVVRTLLVHRWGDRPHHVNLVCAFCGKSQREVRKLIAGPSVYICDACIKVCHDLVSKETGESPTAQMLTKMASKLGLELKRQRRFVLITRLQATIANLGYWLGGRRARSRSTSPIIPRAICRRAASLADELERLPSHEQQSSVTTKSQESRFCCSFCGQSQDDVLKLVAGPAVYICDECLNLCQDIIVEELGEEDRRRHRLQEFAEKARSLALHLNNLPTMPRRISDRASELAAELERLTTLTS